VRRQISAEDLAAIHQTLALFAHTFDNKEIDALAAVFTRDAVVELTIGGGRTLTGLEAIGQFARSLGDDSPDHHTVSTVVSAGEDGVVRAHSRYIAFLVDGSVHNGDYLDVLECTPLGWRISLRISVPRYPRCESVSLSPERTKPWRTNSWHRTPTEIDRGH